MAVSETVAPSSSTSEVHYDVHAVEEKWLPVWERLDPFRADDAAAVVMKVTVATIERAENREMPQMPCPEVQPLAMRVPKPTRPAPSIAGHSCSTPVSSGPTGPATSEYITPPANKPPRKYNQISGANTVSVAP